jgi:hypothetical protein
MSLVLRSDDARKADNFSSIIRETGKYVGVITRAEKLLSNQGTQGLGLSFKSDDGASASYLDIYTVKSNGETLRGYNIVQAIMCCTRIKTADEGKINFDWWDNDARAMVQTSAAGYPSLMGKRIGLLLQQTLESHSITGADTNKLNIVAVFEPGTNLMASEILDKKTKGEKLDKVVQMIMASPIRDNRKKIAGARPAAQQSASANVEFDDDISF